MRRRGGRRRTQRRAGLVRRLVQGQPKCGCFANRVAQLGILDALELVGEGAGQDGLAVSGLSGRRIARLRGDLFDAEAHRVDVDPGRLESNHDLVHEQRQFLRPARGGDVNGQLTAALRARLGARRDALTDDLPPLLAIDGRPGVTRRRLS
jgi:hypothetical protein